MILFILTLFAQADETKTEIDFEAIEITGEVKKPSFAYIEIVERPKFKSLSDICLRTNFQDNVLLIEE